ncbi:MAG: dolichyl-phosphate beta-glucosyltransferase [Actinomycetota bacterium]
MTDQLARFFVRTEVAAPGLDLSIVVPAFNEAERLPVLLQSLRKHVDLDRTEVIVVDDGSTDATAQVVAETKGFASLRVVSHDSNRGKGAAVRTGVQASRGPRIAFVDADDATDLNVLGAMCDRLEGAVGAVFGSRHASGSVVMGSPPIRGLMGRVFNHVVRFAAGTSISDTQCGAKVFRAAVAKVVFADSEIDGFAFDVEILRRLMALDVGVVEHPVRWRYVAGTKIRLLTPVRMLRDITRLRLRGSELALDRIACRFDPVLSDLADPLIDRAVRDGAPCELLFDPIVHARPELEEWLAARELLTS